MWYEHILDNLHKEPVEESTEICGSLDPVTGAKCTRTEHLDKEHTDNSDRGFIFKWKEAAPVTAIIVPGNLL